MKDISERAFPKGHFDEGHFEGRAFPKGERAKGMKGIVHKLEFPQWVGHQGKSVIHDSVKLGIQGHTLGNGDHADADKKYDDNDDDGEMDSLR